jgi:hypothetical protein
MNEASAKRTDRTLSLLTRSSLTKGFAALVMLAVTAIGCAGLMPMRDPPSDDMVHFCEKALLRVQGSKFQGNSKTQLLYYMQLGTYQNACGDYAESTQSFEVAKKIATEQYGISVSEEMITFLINDASGDYRALNYEQAFFPIYNLINYAVMGEFEGALVEARQIDFLLSKLSREQGHTSLYREDAFGRYLTGMLHQEAGDIDNANVSYLKALQVYSMYQKDYGVSIPYGLLRSAMEVANQHSPQAVRLVSKYGTAAPRHLPPGAGEVVVIHQLGLVPEKIEERFTMAFGDGLVYLNRIAGNELNSDKQRIQDFAVTIAADDSITVAFPKFVTRDYAFTDLSLTANGVLSRSSSELVENVGRIAWKDLDDHKTRIYAKTVARAAFYYAAVKMIEQKMREEGASDFQIQLVLAAERFRQAVLERADVRQWESLPDQVKISTLVLPAGDHTLKIRRKGGQVPAGVPLLDDVSVRVTEGRRTFVSIRTAS